MSGPNKPYTRFLQDERGSVFTAALGAVALVGVLSAVAYGLLSGPLRSATMVTKSSKARSDMEAAGQILMGTAVLANLDGDATDDNEPPQPDLGAAHKPTGGGGLPVAVFPNVMVDPWSQSLGYCAWNHGTTATAIAPGILAGNAVLGNGPVVAIISSGPNRVFDTSCGNDPAYLGTPGDDLIYTEEADGDIVGGTGAGAGGGSGGDFWEKTGVGDTIEYKNDSVLVGTVAAPTAASFQVEQDAEIGGDLTVAGATRIEGSVSIDPLTTFDLDGGTSDLTLGSVTNAGTVTADSITGISATTRVDHLDADLLSNAARTVSYDSAYILDRDNFSYIIDPDDLPVITGDLALTRTSATAATSEVTGIAGDPVSSGAPPDGSVWRWNTIAGEFQHWIPQLYDDVTGLNGANTVVRLQARDVSSAAPAANQLMGWNGTAWAPMSVSTTGSATVIGFSHSLNFLATSTTLTSGTCAAAQIPKYNGANWVCSADLVATIPELPIDVDTAPANKRIISMNSSVDPLMGYRGTNNFYTGLRAGMAIETSGTGTDNTLVGYEAGELLSGSHNTFIGAYAGAEVVAGSYNTYLGNHAGFSNNPGNANTVLGYNAGDNASASYSNTTIIGSEAGRNLTSGTNNTLIGYRAAFSGLTTGSNNTYIGYESAPVATGSRNTFVGERTGLNLVGGSNNTLIGYQAGYGAASASFNSHTFVGYEAGYGVNGGTGTVLIGYQAGRNVYDPQHSVMIGYQAGMADGYGQDNIYIGYRAAYTKNGGAASGNVVIGYLAGSDGTTYDSNVFMGNYAAQKAEAASGNVVIGYEAAQYLTSATSNVVVGGSAARDGDGNTNFTGTRNIVTGYQAAYNATVGLTTGSDNIIVGHMAAQGLSTGSGNILIGKGVAITGAGMDDYLTIGTSRAGVGSVLYGSLVTGNLTLKGALTQLSDRRLKRDIRPIENAMQKIMKLNGVVYKWKKSFKDSDRDYLGLIAQDVKKIVPEVVFKLGSNDMAKYLSVAYEQLVPLLIEGIKEQDREIEALNRELDALIAKETEGKS